MDTRIVFVVFFALILFPGCGFRPNVDAQVIPRVEPQIGRPGASVSELCWWMDPAGIVVLYSGFDTFRQQGLSQWETLEIWVDTCDAEEHGACATNDWLACGLRLSDDVFSD